MFLLGCWVGSLITFAAMIFGHNLNEMKANECNQKSLRSFLNEKQ